MVAKFFEGAKVRADAKTTAYAAYAPLDRHIHVTSSNKKISEPQPTTPTSKQRTD